MAEKVWVIRSTFVALLSVSASSAASSARTTVPRFALDPSPIALTGPARPSEYMESSGRRAAFLGQEDGSFEAWVYPLKILHDFELAFAIAGYSEPIPATHLATEVEIRPEASTVRYAHAAFTADVTWFVPLEEPGGLVLLDIDASEPVTVRVRFRTDLDLMWPAALGGQYSYWDDVLGAFVITEGSRRHAALVGSPLGVEPPRQPAHHLPDAPSEFSLHVTPETARKGLVPIAIAASVEGLQAARETYDRLLSSTESLYRETAAHYRKLGEERTSIDTPDDQLDLALEWGKVALDKGFVCNPQLGCGLVAGLGPSGTSERTGFGWFFGGDAFFTSWAMTAYGDFETVRGSLEFLRRRQRDDGKMMHELSQGAAYLRWFEDYPYGYYHADTTPLYIIAVRDYVRASGDLAFAEAFWPSVRKAYAYCETTDEDGDALMDTSAGLAAVETGALRSEEVLTDVYLAAAWTEATEGAAELATVVGDDGFAKRARVAHEKARRSVHSRFLDDDARRIFFAILRDGRGQAEPTVWPALGLWWGVFDAARPAVVGALDQLAGSGLAADWGARMLSRESPLYDPSSYNHGAVWPFLSGFAALALYEHRRPAAAWSYLDGTKALTFLGARGYVPELLSGDRLRAVDAAVPHQLFATAGLVSALLRGLVGLEANTLLDSDGAGSAGSVTVAPQLPPGWDTLRVKHLRWQKSVFNLELARSVAEEDSEIQSLRARVVPRAGPLPLTVELTLPPGAEPIESPVRFVSMRDGGWRLSWTPELRREAETLHLVYRPGIEIQPIHPELRTGDASERLRVIDRGLAGRTYTARLEGRCGRAYRLKLDVPFEVESLENARHIRRSGGTRELEVSFPEGGGEWGTVDLVVKIGPRLVAGR